MITTITTLSANVATVIAAATTPTDNDTNHTEQTQLEQQYHHYNSITLYSDIAQQQQRAHTSVVQHGLVIEEHSPPHVVKFAGKH